MKFINITIIASLASAVAAQKGVSRSGDKTAVEGEFLGWLGCIPTPGDLNLPGTKLLGAECRRDCQCYSDSCTDGTCTGAELGSLCIHNNMCESQNCDLELSSSLPTFRCVAPDEPEPSLRGGTIPGAGFVGCLPNILGYNPPGTKTRGDACTRNCECYSDHCPTPEENSDAARTCTGADIGDFCSQDVMCQSDNCVGWGEMQVFGNEVVINGRCREPGMTIPWTH